MAVTGDARERRARTNASLGRRGGLVLALLGAAALACTGPPLPAETAEGRRLIAQASYEEAHEVLVRAVAQADSELGPTLDRAGAFFTLAELYYQYPPLAPAGEPDALFARAQAEYEALFWSDHPSVGLVLTRRAEALRESGDLEQSEALFARANEIFARSLPPAHPARALTAMGRPVPLYPEELAQVRFTLPTPPAEPAGTAAQIPTTALVAISEQEPAEVTADGTYLQYNVTLTDGTPAYLHPTEADMPWVVAIGTPQRAAAFGSREETRQAAIDAIKMWETALQPHMPWFRLVFVEEDPTAAVQVEWKRRITGPWGGFGGMRWWTSGGRLRVGGGMEISTTPSNFSTLEIGDVAKLVGHEFGHVLGLGHCLSCDSAMNYAWSTSKESVVTELDVRTFLALVEQPNPRIGSR